MARFSDGQQVTANVAGKRYHARIRGVAMTDMHAVGKLMIIEVVDGQLPNATYAYRCLAVPEINLTAIQPQEFKTEDEREEFMLRR